MIVKEILGDKNQNFFFGYYDKTPWNYFDNKILSHSIKIKNNLPTVNDFAEVGFFEKNKKWEFKKIDQTNLWNYQQGAMLQWISNEEIIFNQLYKNKIASKIININHQKNTYIDLPIYALSNNKKYFLSTSFDQISLNRKGYNLPYIENAKLNKSNHGIWFYDLKNNKKKIIIPFEFFFDNGFVKNDECWIDHIIISPNDDKFVFFLRNNTSDGGVYTRLFKYDFLTQNTECILDTGMASHGDWLDNETFIIWARKSNVAKTILKNEESKIINIVKKIYRKIKIPNWFRNNIFKDRFLLIDLKTKKNEYAFKNLPLEIGGGHFTIEKNTKNWVLNDTPLNNKNLRELIIHDIYGNNKIVLDELYADPKIHFSPIRCDLHPRWNHDKTKVCIDNINENGNRNIVLYDISQLNLLKN
tara:strand:- start:68 stop:1312 length:1245 start_codon:yes stop_codon:yes gene_type:complete